MGGGVGKDFPWKMEIFLQKWFSAVRPFPLGKCMAPNGMVGCTENLNHFQPLRNSLSVQTHPKGMCMYSLFCRNREEKFSVGKKLFGRQCIFSNHELNSEALFSAAFSSAVLHNYALKLPRHAFI